MKPSSLGAQVPALIAGSYRSVYLEPFLHLVPKGESLLYVIRSCVKCSAGRCDDCLATFKVTKRSPKLIGRLSASSGFNSEKTLNVCTVASSRRMCNVSKHLCVPFCRQLLSSCCVSLAVGTAILQPLRYWTLLGLYVSVCVFGCICLCVERGNAFVRVYM